MSIDERDELLEEIERVVNSTGGDVMEMDAALDQIAGLFNRARIKGVVRYPEP